MGVWLGLNFLQVGGDFGVVVILVSGHYDIGWLVRGVLCCMAVSFGLVCWWPGFACWIPVWVGLD